MQRKEIVSQRPLFTEWPAWQQLPTEVRQQVEHLLANMCLELVNPTNGSNDQEQSHEQPSDQDATS